jgi:hypothetical protein
MGKAHPDVEIAKITSRQAIVVALIGALAGVITTLIGGTLLRQSSAEHKEVSPPETEQLRKDLADARQQIQNLTNASTTGSKARILTNEASMSRSTPARTSSQEGILAAITKERNDFQQRATQAERQLDELTKKFGSVARPPSMAISSLELTMDQTRCVDAAATAFDRAGGTAIKRGNTSVFADDDLYSWTIHCPTSKRIAFFVITGPDSSIAERQRNRVHDAFVALQH